MSLSTRTLIEKVTDSLKCYQRVLSSVLKRRKENSKKHEMEHLFTFQKIYNNNKEWPTMRSLML